MKCEPTNVPSATEIDIPALREKYRQERDKRLRSEGQAQYIEPVGEFADVYDSDPFTPVEPRGAISEDLDIAILGAGFGGLLAAYHLKQAGISTFRNIDHAGDFGGCWYWNRYPGIQCDNDAYCYLPLLEEMNFMPSKKFADGLEIYQYIQSIAKRFDLHKNALFHTKITAIRWDESIKRWHVSTNRGDDIRARFVIMASGPLNKPKLPGIPGLQEYQGKMFHTARWEYDYTGGSWENPVLDKLANKRVAIIGTGATAIQAVPYLGRYAKQLYVIQRTPSSVDERKNAPTAPEWVKTLKPGWQQERQRSLHHGIAEGFAKNEPDLVCDIWTELNRNLNAELEAEGWPELTNEQFMARREMADYQVMERLRRRVDSIVNDKQTAEILKPWYRFLCKRPCSNDDYYATFNRPNVKLLDVSATRGVEGLTTKGFIHNGTEYEVDCIILASGFEMTSGLKKRWGIDIIEGRNGTSIYDDWAEGYKTLHGMMSHNFPNQFFIGFIQGGVNASTTETWNGQAHHIAWLIKETQSRGATVIEPSLEAQNSWIREIRESPVNDHEQFARECTPSYYNNEGEEKIRWYLGEFYGPGWDAFQELMEKRRQQRDLGGFDLVVE